ncbi:hypothetical protein ACWGJ9_02025 [Curtobacterium citreum]
MSAIIATSLEALAGIVFARIGIGIGALVFFTEHARRSGLPRRGPS